MQVLEHVVAQIDVGHHHAALEAVDTHRHEAALHEVAGAIHLAAEPPGRERAQRLRALGHASH